MEMRKQKCACCGKETTNLEPQFLRPDAYVKLSEEEKQTLAHAGDDLCRVGDRYFIRTVMPIPVIGREVPFSVGIWVEVDFKDFKFYVENFNVDCEGKFRGVIANSMPNHAESVMLGVEVRLRGKADRPAIFVLDADHPLSKMQNKGISQHDLLEFFGPRYQ